MCTDVLVTLRFVSVSTTPDAVVTIPPPEDVYNSSYTVDIVPLGPHVCITEDQLNTTCFENQTLPSPAYWLDTDTGIEYCNNAVVQVGRVTYGM